MAANAAATATVPAASAPRSVSRAVPVFVSGHEGYRRFRIPAIVRLPDGDLLAFADANLDGTADFGNVRIVMKRSRDGGRSWSALQVVASNGNLQADNAAPVVDTLDPDHPDGRVFLFYDTGNAPEQDIRKGIGRRDVWYRTSIDGGRTWSTPVDITREARRPAWRAYANTPGHALQLAHGIYKGRIYVAANHSEGPPQPDFHDYRANGFYTDDHGRTFHVSRSVDFPGSNEATAAELAGNGLMMNMRNQSGEPRARIVAISSDGGERWNRTWVDRALPDPVCEGSLLDVGDQDGKAILAFSNDADSAHRRNLTLRISFDGGRSWDRSYPVDARGAGTGYSDIVVVAPHEIGVLYERDDYSRIVFRTVRWRPFDGR